MSQVTTRLSITITHLSPEPVELKPFLCSAWNCDRMSGASTMRCCCDGTELLLKSLGHMTSAMTRRETLNTKVKDGSVPISIQGDKEEW